MTVDQITYSVFGIVLVLALVFDLGLLSKKNQDVSIKQALNQTFFWVGLALAFFFFMWYEKGQGLALEYLSAYLMEWSLSIDNIFVFIILISTLKVKKESQQLVLLFGILIAIVLRVILIFAGVALVTRFTSAFYVFGAFLIFTAWKLINEKEEVEEDEGKLITFANLPDSSASTYSTKSQLVVSFLSTASRHISTSHISDESLRAGAKPITLIALLEVIVELLGYKIMV